MGSCIFKREDWYFWTGKQDAVNRRKNRVVGECLCQPQTRSFCMCGAVRIGRQYFVCKCGSEAKLIVELPKGTYRAEWVNTKTGKLDKTETFRHANGNRTLLSPKYVDDIALRIRRAPRSRWSQEVFDTAKTNKPGTSTKPLNWRIGRYYFILKTNFVLYIEQNSKRREKGFCCD